MSFPGSNALAQLAAFGVCAPQGHGFTYSATEHGVILGLYALGLSFPGRAIDGRCKAALDQPDVHTTTGHVGMGIEPI